MYRILIVEDDAGIAEAVSEQAKMWNFETHSVTTVSYTHLDYLH